MSGSGAADVDIADATTVLQAEVERLRDENRRLRDQLDGRRSKIPATADGLSTAFCRELAAVGLKASPDHRHKYRAAFARLMDQA